MQAGPAGDRCIKHARARPLRVPAVNQEDFDTKEDYLRWRRLDFSFCADNA